VSGPGWLPSRPRPLGQVRRRLTRYTTPLRKAARRARAAEPTQPTQPTQPWMCSMAVAAAVAANDAAARREARVFAARRAKLPVATLLPPRSEGRPRMMSGAVQRWFGHRWLWIQPRMIPLIAAFVGLIAVLNARRYLLELARGPAVVCPATTAADAAHQPTSAPASAGDPRCATTHASR